MTHIDAEKVIEARRQAHVESGAHRGHPEEKDRGRARACERGDGGVCGVCVVAEAQRW